VPSELSARGRSQSKALSVRHKQLEDQHEEYLYLGGIILIGDIPIAVLVCVGLYHSASAVNMIRRVVEVRDHQS
jgi:uncharacterized membrane protein